MDIAGLLVQLVSGAAGGNIAGALLKQFSLGPVGNSVVGVLGGGLGGQLLGMLGLGGGGVRERREEQEERRESDSETERAIHR